MKLLSCFLFLFSATNGYAQNIGIGTVSPVASLDVNGSFKVSASYLGATKLPTVAQTFTMINAATQNMLSADSIARVFDPGGPAGNYIANLNSIFIANANFNPGSYLELQIESVDLGTGDSLIIHDGVNVNAPVLYRTGNGFTAGNISVSFSSNQGFVVFKSNADGITGQGFSLLFKRKFINGGIPDPAVITGRGLVFYPGKAALRAGTINAGTIGNNSIALGNQNIASGTFSTALGDQATASGTSSLAMGYITKASGGYSTALGYNTQASGDYSTALGKQATASGYSSISMGVYSMASGFNSFAMGYNTQALSDYSTAIGYEAIASGYSSIALGTNTHASGTNSITMGISTNALGYSSTAMGGSTHASGSYSIATGYNTKAKSYAALAIGRYNDTLATENATTWQATDRVFVIGDGTSNTARSNCFYVLKNGNGWMQGTLTQASDIRLKKDIVPLRNVLPRLLSLSGYNYYWKNTAQMPDLQAGLIAQEVQRQMPELVSISNTDGELAVNYSGMVPYLLEGIKEQQAALHAQSEKINMMEEEIKAMKKILLSAKKK
jgi:hypothetical protein